MRVLLLHSVDAGDGLSQEQVRQSLESAGHELLHVVQSDADLERMLSESPEVLVAAGGDATVRRAAIAVAGRGVPLAILPLGTANNVAESLGIEGSILRLIERWDLQYSRPLDLGVAHGHWGECRFLEGVGGGLIATGIAAMSGQRHEKQEDSRSRISRAVRQYQDLLAGAKPQRCTLTLDGTRLDAEELLIVEVLNIRSIGPNLVFSPEVDSSDGYFSVVTAADEHREALAEYLRQRYEGNDPRLCLPTRRARRVEIDGWDQLHVDDTIRRGSSSASIDIEPAAVRVLA